MKTKVFVLTEEALDWAVEEATGNNDHTYFPRSYSTDWFFGGPIIQEGSIQLMCEPNKNWRAQSACISNPQDWISGETALIAAMRAYVVARMGEEIDVPEKFLDMC